ncbi:MAG: hypothetical protein LZ174_06430 [Thaumarchaeota archaeon]|nr:hypothetical protein [Candidatus Geocrenenecus arthurdayi]
MNTIDIDSHSGIVINYVTNILIHKNTSIPARAGPTYLNLNIVIAMRKYNALS